MSLPESTASSVPIWTLRHDDGVPVLELPQMPFESLRDWLVEQMPMHEDLLGRTARIDLGAAQIALFDLRRTVHLLREHFNVEVTGLYADQAAILRFAERELKLKLFPHPEPEPPLTPTVVDDEDLDVSFVFDDAAPSADTKAGAAEPESTDPALDAPEPQALPSPDARIDPGRRTLQLHKTLRSGAVVRFDGDVLLFGDVNPGAQIIAAGSVIVLGSLKGEVHAGAQGDKSATILAFTLRPTQLRIARTLAHLSSPATVPGFHPEIATISGSHIDIAPFSGRVPQR